jgi:hypothetical protein
MDVYDTGETEIIPMDRVYSKLGQRRMRPNTSGIPSLTVGNRTCENFHPSDRTNEGLQTHLTIEEMSARSAITLQLAVSRRW